MLGASAKTPPFKLVLAFHLHVGHHHSQHLFMHVDSRYPISHKLLLAGAESVPKVTFSRVTGYRRSRLERGNAQLFAQLRTLPIRHTNSLDRSSGDSTSSLPPLPILPDTRSNFHELLRAAGPRRHTRTTGFQGTRMYIADLRRRRAVYDYKYYTANPQELFL